MRKMKASTRIGLAFLVAATITGCESIIPRVNNVKVSPIKRYSDNKVLNLNRLEVDWSKNEKCKKLNPKYGFTTGNVIYDNVAHVLKSSDRQGIFREGFEKTPSLVSMARNDYSGGYYLWKDKEIFVIESSQPESTLVQIGEKIYDCACNDPELY